MPICHERIRHDFSTARRLAWSLASCAALLLAPASAGAQRRRVAPTPVVAVPVPTSAAQDAAGAADAVARSHFDRGVALSGMGDYESALIEFRASYDIRPRPNVLFNLGATYQALHRYVRASRAIEQYLNEATLTAVRRADVERGLAQIRTYIAHIVLPGLPDGAVITLDREPWAMTRGGGETAVSAGRHDLEVTAPGFVATRQAFTIGGGETRSILVVMRAAEATVARPVDSTIPVLPAVVVVRGLPAGATLTIDGIAAPLDRAVQLSAGPHDFVARARGWVPWRGGMESIDGVSRTARVSMVRDNLMSAAPFGVATAATIAFGVGGIAMVVLASATQRDFNGLTQEDPRAAELARIGPTQFLLADGLLIATAIAGTVAVALLTRTRFAPAAATVRWSDRARDPSAPIPLGVRF